MARTGFGALLEPRSIYVIEYRTDAAGVRVLGHSSVAGDFADIDAASNSLADVINSMGGGRGQSAIVAVRGFGVCYRLLTLPPASRDVLEPVVAREMKRLHPEIVAPVVDFSVSGQLERRRSPDDDEVGAVHERRGGETIPPAEILAGTAPSHVVDVLTAALARYGVALEHLTIAPQAMARVYTEADGAPDASAVAMMLPAGPLFGVFHNGGLRFVSEPPGSPDEMSAEIQTVIDQLSRGRMYLRQRFRGADISRIYVAVDPDEQDHFRAVLATTLDVDVLPLVSGMGPPGAIAALGAVLDAKKHEGLSLYPSAEVRRENAQRSRGRLLNVAAASIATLALLWGAWSVYSARAAVADLREARTRSAAAMTGLEPVRAVVEERRANAHRAAAIHTMTLGRLRMARTVTAIGASTPPGVTVGRIVITADPAGAFHGELAGNASGLSGAQAFRALDRYVDGLPRVLGTSDVQLADFTQSEDANVVNFRITFGMPAIPQTARPTP